MSEQINTLLCFRRPSEGNYIGGLVTLCNDYIDKRDLFKSEGINIGCFNYEIPKDSLWNKLRISKIRNIIYGAAQIHALKSYLKKDPATCVHIHTSRKALFFKDIILAKSIRKVCKAPIIMTIHVGDVATVFHNKFTRQFLIRMMNQSIDNVLFLSERMRQQFIDAGLNEQQAKVLYNFYNITPVSPIDKPENHTTHLIYLGSINREKGIIELLSAMKKSKHDFHLDLCGTIIEESIRPEFESLLNSLYGKVTFHGYVDKAAKEKLLRSADILLLPSYREGLPISILEAMATSCAIITTPVGAIPEILCDENAIIIEPRNTEALGKAIDYLIERPDAIKAMKSANFTKSLQFSDSVHINRLCELYKQQASTDTQN